MKKTALGKGISASRKLAQWRSFTALLAIVFCIALTGAALGASGTGQAVLLKDVHRWFGWEGHDLFSGVYTGQLNPKLQYTFKLRPDGLPAANFGNQQYILMPEGLAEWHGDSGMQSVLLYYQGGSQFGRLLADGRLQGVEVPFPYQADNFVPSWMAKAQSASLPDVIGHAVQAATIPGGYLAITDMRTGNAGIYRFDERWQNQSMVFDLKGNRSECFCVVDGIIYLSSGYLRQDGSFTAYGDKRFSTWPFTLIGTDGKYLIFRTREDSGMLLRTNLKGEQGMELWNTKDTKHIKFRYCSVSGGLLLCSYENYGHFTNASNQLGNRSEYDLKLFDIASGREIKLDLPVAHEESSNSLRLLSRAYWAQIHGSDILLVDAPSLAQLSVCTIATGTIRPLLASEDILLAPIDRMDKPILAVLDGWLYHLYAHDNRMLLRTRLDGSVTSEYVATFEHAVQQLTAVNGRLIALSGTGGNRSYADITP